MTAEKFDEKFEKGEETLKYFDQASFKVVEPHTKRIVVDCPEWLVDEMDSEATRLAIPRQSIIKIWLAEQAAKHRLLTT